MDQYIEKISVVKHNISWMSKHNTGFGLWVKNKDSHNICIVKLSKQDILQLILLFTQLCVSAVAFTGRESESCPTLNCIFFSHANYLHVPPPRPDLLQFQAQHPSADKISPLYTSKLSLASLAWSPKHWNMYCPSDVLSLHPNHLTIHPGHRQHFHFFYFHFFSYFLLLPLLLLLLPVNVLHLTVYVKWRWIQINIRHIQSDENTKYFSSHGNKHGWKKKKSTLINIDVNCNKPELEDFFAWLCNVTSSFESV